LWWLPFVELPKLPGLPNIAEIDSSRSAFCSTQTALHNSLLIWILWQLPILAIVRFSIALAATTY
jgi:hypothetical protein